MFHLIHPFNHDAAADIGYELKCYASLLSFVISSPDLDGFTSDARHGASCLADALASGIDDFTKLVSAADYVPHDRQMAMAREAAAAANAHAARAAFDPNGRPSLDLTEPSTARGSRRKAS